MKRKKPTPKKTKPSRPCIVTITGRKDVRIVTGQGWVDFTFRPRPAVPDLDACARPENLRD